MTDSTNAGEPHDSAPFRAGIKAGLEQAKAHCLDLVNESNVIVFQAAYQTAADVIKQAIDDHDRSEMKRNRSHE